MKEERKELRQRNNEVGENEDGHRSMRGLSADICTQEKQRTKEKCAEKSPATGSVGRK